MTHAGNCAIDRLRQRPDTKDDYLCSSWMIIIVREDSHLKKLLDFRETCDGGMAAAWIEMVNFCVDRAHKQANRHLSNPRTVDLSTSSPIEQHLVLYSSCYTNNALLR
jgi:hypothetical protein